MTDTSVPENAAPVPAASAHRLWLIVTALVPCVLSLWFTAGSTDIPALAITRPRPALLFATYLYHHGDEPVALDSTLESEFRFRNEGDEPVTIGEIQRSCGCMTPRISQTEVGPGEYGSIFVPIQTINQSPGPHEYTLTVHYRDPEPRETTLSIKATFPEKMVVVQPKALYLSQQSEKSIPFDVTISDFRDRTLNVTAVESTSVFVSAQHTSVPESVIVQTGYSQTDDTPPNVARLKITGEVAPEIPPGRHHALIAAATDDVEFAVVTIPMIINGPAYADGQAPVVSPPQIRLTASDHPKAKRRAQVQVVVPSDWQISHASAWPGGLTVNYGDAVPFTETEKMVTVDVELSELPEHQVADGIVQLFANDGKNLVTIRTSFLWP